MATTRPSSETICTITSLRPETTACAGGSPAWSCACTDATSCLAEVTSPCSSALRSEVTKMKAPTVATTSATSRAAAVTRTRTELLGPVERPHQPSARSRYPAPRRVSMSDRPNGLSTLRRNRPTYTSTMLGSPSNS